MRTAIRSSIIPLTCASPKLIRLQLSEAISIISRVDFPDLWPTLLVELVTQMQGAAGAANMQAMLGVLEVASSVFERFPSAPDTEDNELRLALLKALESFAAPLTQVFVSLSAVVLPALDVGTPSDPIALRCLKVMCQCFFQLNWVDLPEFFEDNMVPWMENFHRFLLPRPASLLASPEDPEEGLLEALQASVLECLDLYAEKYGEEFEPYLNVLVQDLWNLLSTIPPASMLAPNMDNLVSRAVRLLSTLIAKPQVAAQFSEESLVRGIIQRIVAPNSALRQSDLELLEDNPADFIAREIEGSDSETRRRVACDLVKSLIKTSSARVIPIAMEVITSALSEYEGNKEKNEVMKDTAVALLTAVAVKQSSVSIGVLSLNEGVPLADFLGLHIIPELQFADINARPIARAACIKFITTFRGLFGKGELSALLPTLARLLDSKHYLVHTYAAAALERILTIQDKEVRSDGGKEVCGSTLRVGMDVINPLATPILASIFSRMTAPGYSENEFLMRCVMRVVTSAKAGCVEAVGSIAGGLSNILARVCKNPSNPVFNHFMFESFASLMRSSCTVRPELLREFESILFLAAEVVLTNDVLEFLPYMFQLLGEALDLRALPAPGSENLSEPFKALLPRLLIPATWSRKSSVPALTPLLKCYLSKGSVVFLRTEGMLETVLGIWRMLMSTKGHEVWGFQLFDALVANISHEVLGQHLTPMFQVMLSVVQASKAIRIASVFIHSISLLCGLYGPEAFTSRVATFSPGLLSQLLTVVFSPLAGRVTGVAHRKETSVGLTRLLCETPSLLADPSSVASWESLLVAIVGLQGSNEGSPVESSKTASLGGSLVFMENEDIPKDEEGPAMEYTSSYNRLVYCAIPYVYAFPSIPGPSVFLSQSLARLAVASPLVGPIIAKSTVAAAIELLPKA